MSQHDFNIANQTFPSFRSDLNDALQAAATISAGATAPTTPYAYQLWYDTANEKYMIRNAANSAWLNFVGIDTNGNVDVTGTVTADGLTVENTAAVITLKDTDTSDNVTGYLDFRTSADVQKGFVGFNGLGDFELNNLNNNGINFSSTNVLRANIASNGDISFYDDTGTSAKFFWDASTATLDVDGELDAGNLTDAVTHRFDSLNGSVAYFTSGGTVGGGIVLGDSNSTANANRIRGEGNELTFDTDSTERLRISADGEVTKPYQPSFMVKKNADQTLTVNSNTTITWQAEIWDVGGNFASNTFTAPVTGKYYLQTQMRIDSFDTAAGYYLLAIITSNRTKYVIVAPNFTSDLAYYSMSVGSVFDMDAGDTASVYVNQSSGTASHIEDSPAYTSFSGYLLG